MWQQLYLVSLAALATALPTSGSSSHGNPIRLTTQRRSYVSEDGHVLPEVLTLFNNTLKKYKVGSYIAPYPIPASNARSKRQSTSVPLTDQCQGNNDLLYFGPTNIRNKTFQIDFDTGSADFFVPGGTCGLEQGCPGTAKYDGAGQDLGNTTRVTYGSGAVAGRNFLDTVSIGNLSAEGTNVVVLTQAQGFSNLQSDGLMGLAFSTIANSKQPTFVEKLIAEKKISTKEFCFYMGRCSDSTGVNSELTIGGRNPSKFTGNMMTVPVKTQDYWRVAVDGVNVNGLQLPVRGDAAIDTGTTAIVASGAYAIPLNQALGGIPIPLGGTGNLQLIAYAYQCNAATTANLSLTLAGQNFPINPKDLSIGTIELGFANIINHPPLTAAVQAAQQSEDPAAVLCLSSILQADIGPTMDPPVANFNVVGDSFLKNWYSCYSYDGASGKPAVLLGKSV